MSCSEWYPILCDRRSCELDVEDKMLASYLHGRLMYILMCSKWLFEAEMLSCRTSFEEHTYMSLIVKRRNL